MFRILLATVFGRRGSRTVAGVADSAVVSQDLGGMESVI